MIKMYQALLGFRCTTGSTHFAFLYFFMFLNIFSLTIFLVIQRRFKKSKVFLSTLAHSLARGHDVSVFISSIFLGK